MHPAGADWVDRHGEESIQEIEGRCSLGSHALDFPP